MNKQPMRAAGKSLVIFVAILLLVTSALSQQLFTGADISRIKEEIERRQSIDQTLDIPEPSRANNRRILQARQEQLRTLVEIEGLQKYKSILGSHMHSAEGKKMEDDLARLKEKFTSLERSISGDFSDIVATPSFTATKGGDLNNPSLNTGTISTPPPAAPISDATTNTARDLNAVRSSRVNSTTLLGDRATISPAIVRGTQTSILCTAPLTPGLQPSEKYQIDSIYGVVLPPTNFGDQTVDRFSILVFLSDRVTPLPSELTASNISITFLPSGKRVPAKAIREAIEVEAASNCRRLEIVVDYDYTDPTQVDASGNLVRGLSRPEGSDQQVKVEISSLKFEQKSASNLTGIGKIYNSLNFSDLGKDIQTIAAEGAAVNKTSEEKDIFAGINVSIPSGGGGSTEGSGDINVNRTFYSPRLGEASIFDRINFGLQLKKGSENRADPRHFTFGFNFRKTFLRINDQDLNAIRSALFTTPTSLTNDRDVQGRALRAVNNLQDDFIRAFLWDNALRFEGDVKGASIGNISNLLLDSQLQIATVTRAFAGDTGFLNVRLIPVGLEAGYNLNNGDNPTQEKHSLARIKTGGVVTLFYEARDPASFLNRVEFETQAVTRYLFRRESSFEEMTNRAVLTDKGNKYWLQSNLKFLFGQRIGPARAGFRFSFNRGSLPPVYSFTKAFNFGVVFETTDESTAKEIEK